MKKILCFLFTFLVLQSGFAQHAIPDSTFGVLQSFAPNFIDIYGTTASNFDGRVDHCYGTLHIPDGRIIMAGFSEGSDGVDFALTRLFSNGQYDTTLGPLGQLRLDLGHQNDSCLAAVLDHESRILMGGCTDKAGIDRYVGLLIRADINGVLDTTFGEQGQVILDLPTDNDIITHIQLMADGRIVLAGIAAYGTNKDVYAADSTRTFIGRLMPNGDRDTTFGEQGFIFPRWHPVCDISVPGAISVDTLERIVVTGTSDVLFYGESDLQNDCDYLFRVFRFLPDGQVDTEFGTNGIVEFEASASARGNAVIHDDQGRILVAGMTGVSWRAGPTNYTFFTRLLSDGTPDPSFGNNGVLKTREFSSDGFQAGEVEPVSMIRTNGRIIAAFLLEPNVAHFAHGALFLTENGVIDSTVNGNGRFFHEPGAACRFHINQITSTEPSSFFISGYYRCLEPYNMLVHKVKMDLPSGTTTTPVVSVLASYPNPVRRGGESVLLVSDATGPFQLRVFNMQGQLCLQQQLTPDGGRLRWQTGQLPEGVYTVSLTNATGWSVGRVVVVE
jgi:uncharacterized delta-60 repeat protein